MSIGSVQKYLTWGGYYGNYFMRQSIASATSAMRSDQTTCDRAQNVFLACISTPLAAALVIPSAALYLTGSYAGTGRFELIEPEKSSPSWDQTTIKVMSLNLCFDVLSPISGGVVTPFEKVDEERSRVAAIADAISEIAPQVLTCQECETIGAQEEFIQRLRKQGFTYFIRDLGCHTALKNHSGLFAASKVPIRDFQFASFPPKHRMGTGKGSTRGAFSFTISVNGKDLRIVNTHLNAGNPTLALKALREKQLKKHVMPLMQGASILLGDFNCDTRRLHRKRAGLEGFTNAIAGRLTCTDKGTIRLFGPQSKKPTKTSIDGLIYNRDEVEVVEATAQFLPEVNRHLLTDHAAVVATVAVR